MKRLYFLMVFLAVLMPAMGQLSAKPPYKNTRHYYNSSQAVQNSYADTSAADDLRHEVENHEIELRMFEERLNTQETILDTLRQQFLDANLANKQMLKGNTVSLEKQVTGMESSLSGMVKDMKDLQTHANDTAKSLAQYKKRIADLEKQISQVQSSVDTIYTALQIDEGKNDAGSQTYVVQSGDFLDKIARKHKTTVKKIKELNGLTNDRIIVGQKLKIP